MTYSVLINGQSEQSVPVTDRGLAYGHGLFETIALNQSTPVAWQAHLARLRTDAERLAISLSADIDQLLEQDLTELLRLQSVILDRSVLKITITRGCGGRGYSVDDSVSINRIVQLNPFPDYPDKPSEKGISLRLCATRLAIAPQLAGIKHLNRLEQVLARAEWQSSDFREGVVLDAEGFLAEGTMSNLFWCKNGTLYTPELDRCGVNGIVRQRIIAIAEEQGIKLSIGRYKPDCLVSADEVIVCNSVIGVWPVVSAVMHENNRLSWSIGSMTRKLQSMLAAEGIY
ncbi:aminodeoxychorismate lyase [Amphritea japonica]|uniref:Aminodeoxychorismate lyase n=1 Tax=Amphritea japonica ATCC BAA-1530 TaxID=1278309 RepID=A0A7R6PBY6_9GAMM|nr:aminodeoxychorismate lyase [Amphritea japonica]BBB26211.1 4-amino-4-deoxychorismate lyase [Amphritea japonica ATCC BAA-1530]